MLTYNFENIDSPLYEHIYKCIKSDIVNGIIKRGEKLPSKRAFAKNNGISSITVENAYNQLISEGYIYSLPRKGYYVSDNLIIRAYKRPSENQNFKNQNLNNQSFKNWSINNQNINIEYGNIDNDDRENISDKNLLYKNNLSNNSMPASGFPFSVWAKLMRETLSGNRENLMKPSPTGGIFELREAISEHLRSFRGMSVHPSQIIIGAGTEYLYGLLIQLLGRDKIYCIENPVYKKIPMIYEKNKVVYKYADMDEKGIIPEEIRNTEANIVHISTAHHFPTGITMPASRRYEIISWANEKEGRYIIEDDYDSEFRYSGKPIPPLFAIDDSEKSIYINTFSKSLASTMRISYMVLPRHLIDEFYRELSFYSCTVSNFEQYTLAKFIERGYFDKHISRRRIHYSKKRQEVLSRINNNPIAKKCEIIENDSGLHFLIKLNTKMGDRELIEKLNKKGISISALSEYYYRESINSNADNKKSKKNINYHNEDNKVNKEKEEDMHIFLVNYSNIDIKNLDKVLNIIYQIIDFDSI